MKLIILLILLVIPFNVEAEEYTNGFGIKMTEEEIEKLEMAGFSEDEIYLMNEDIFIEYTTNNYVSVATTNKYMKNTVYFNGDIDDPKSKPIHEESFEITEEEYENASTEIQTRGICGSVSTTYKLLTSDIIYDSTNNKYKYKANLKWKKMPKVREYDLIGIGIDSNVSVIGSGTTFSNSVVYSDGSTATKTSATETRISQTGIAKYFPLYKDTSSKTVKNMNITMIAPVQKKTTSTITVLNNYADYSHGVKSVPFDSIDVSISIYGFSFGGSTSIPEFDSMSTAQAIYDGIKW